MDQLSDNLNEAQLDTQQLRGALRDALKDSNGALTVVLMQLIEQTTKIEQTIKAINI